MTNFRSAALAIVGFVLATSLALPAASLADSPYEITSFSARTTDAAEANYTAAGGHPDKNVTEFSFSGAPSGGYPSKPFAELKDSYVTLAPGFVGNPAAAARCPISGLKVNPDGSDGSNCPAGSQVGIAHVVVSAGSGDFLMPMYNLVPEAGYPAQFGFPVPVLGVNQILSVVPLPRTESYGLRVGSSNLLLGEIPSFGATFFGIPSEHGSGTSPAPFLSNPVDCSDAEPTWKLLADSWENPGALLPNGFPDLADPNWLTASVVAPPVTGCDDPALASQFDPAIDVKPLQGGGPIQADQPAGLAVDFDFPQTNDPTDLSTTFDPMLPQAPEPKDITVKLPAGLSISPSSADGLGACSDLASDPAGDQVHYDNTKPVTCPDSSKIGSAVATSPLLATHDPVTDEVNGAEPIPGDVYLIKPHPGDLPIGGGDQDGTFRLLIQLENADRGINFKLPGTAIADKNTGQLTTTFPDNPQLPAKHLTVNLKSGPTGAAGDARSPAANTSHDDPDLVPWSTPGTPDATPSTSFNVDRRSERDRPAPPTPAPRPFSPTLSAGTESAKPAASQPLRPQADPQRRRTGAQLPRRDHPEGLHRQARRRPLLLRGSDRRRRRQERSRRAGQPLLPGR